MRCRGEPSPPSGRYDPSDPASQPASPAIAFEEFSQADIARLSPRGRDLLFACLTRPLSADTSGAAAMDQLRSILGVRFPDLPCEHAERWVQAGIGLTLRPAAELAALMREPGAG